MGMGISYGPNRAIEAAQKAMCSPLLEEGSVEGARGVLLNITGGPSMSLHEIEEAASIIQETADPKANIIVGQVINPEMGEELIVTVIATGFEREEDSAAATIGADRGMKSADETRPISVGRHGCVTRGRSADERSRSPHLFEKDERCARVDRPSGVDGRR